MRFSELHDVFNPDPPKVEKLVPISSFKQLVPSEIPTLV